ncbi:MAG: hypothetical protein MZV70_71210 [Desulfobacterales bacterium]|nr:hypothetical protein [Desulfobacterales bacterium]
MICIAVGVPRGLGDGARTKLPGREFLDSLTTLILALPGTGIGIAYMRAFRDPLPYHRPRPSSACGSSSRSSWRCGGCPTRCAGPSPRC